MVKVRRWDVRIGADGGPLGKVRVLRGPDIDLEAAVWTIPTERMKGAHEHRV